MWNQNNLRQASERDDYIPSQIIMGRYCGAEMSHAACLYCETNDDTLY